MIMVELTNLSMFIEGCFRGAPSITRLGTDCFN